MSVLFFVPFLLSRFTTFCIKYDIYNLVWYLLFCQRSEFLTFLHYTIAEIIRNYIQRRNQYLRTFITVLSIEVRYSSLGIELSV